MTDFESKFGLKSLTTQLMSLAVAKNVLIEQVFELADREVDGTPSCKRDPLFFIVIVGTHACLSSQYFVSW